MNASELKKHIEQTDGESHFFTRKSMSFFGDRMSNYGVRPITIQSNYDATGTYCPDGAARDVWELYRRKPVKHGLTGSHYFDRVTFKAVHTK